MASKDLQPLNSSMLRIFLRSQFCATPVPPPPSTSLIDKTAIITGSNIGIGLECARQFLDLQLSHLIMAVRSVEKGEQAAAELRKAHPKASVEVWALDMLSYESIQAFAKRCETSLSRLDIAILNAGMTRLDFVVNESTGHEEMFQVNYLSTALLSILMLPVLKAKSPPKTPGRLTIVSSGTALLSKFANHAAVPLFPTFDDSTGWNMNSSTERYSVTKTMLLMFTLKLSECVNVDDVVVNTVDPGLIGGTNLQRNIKAPIVRAVMGLMKATSARPLKQGAWTYIDAAIVKGKETHGSYVMDWRIHPFHDMMYTPQGKTTTEKVWEETLEELKFAHVAEIVNSMD